MLDYTHSENNRLKRYALAEQSLKAALSHTACSEPEPRDLQIRTLKQAIAMLTTRARDAEQRSEALRMQLLDRQLDPTVYSSLQQERWKEEKRRLAVQDELNGLQAQLEMLSVGGDVGKSISISPEERRQINLARFLLSSHSPPLHKERSFKRMTVQDPPSRRLRPLSLTPKRPHSVDNHRESVPDTEQASSMNKQTPRKVPGRPGISTKSSPSLRSPTSSSSQSSPVTSSTDFSPKTAWFTLDDDEAKEGTAVIYQKDSQVAVNSPVSEEIQVDMPDYARNLIEEFDSFVAAPNLPFSSPSQKAPSTLFTPLPPSTPPSPRSERITPDSPGANPHISRLRRKQSQRSSLFSISEAISSRISFVSDHMHSPFSPKPSMSSLRSPQPSSHPRGGLETVGEVDPLENHPASSPSKLSFATRIKRRVLDRH
ncbi:hypothetical protein ONZ45_g9011 [Pleurotus djamor]|nr:hypothetical protein ONZ45_g9011 [Pleurotus djamor]